MDLQSYLRLVNMFPTQPDPSGGTGVGPGMQSMMDDSGDTTNSPPLFTPSSQMSDQFMTALGNMPQRPQPSGLRTIAAGIAGMGAGASPAGISMGQPIGFRFNQQAAQQASDNVKYGDYNKQEQDWLTQLRALSTGVGEEEKSNVLGERLAKDTASNKIAQEKIDISGDRAQAYEFAKNHPTWKPVAEKGGTLKYVNPIDPTQVVDTGIDTGTLTDEDKLNLQQNNRIASIDERGTQSRQTEADKETNRQKDINARGSQARETKEDVITKPSIVQKPLTPQQEKIATYNKAQELTSAHPEWAKYIHLGAGNTVVVDSPGIFTGPDRDTVLQIHNAIYGASNDPLGIRK